MVSRSKDETKRRAAYSLSRTHDKHRCILLNQDIVNGLLVSAVLGKDYWVESLDGLWYGCRRGRSSRRGDADGSRSCCLQVWDVLKVGYSSFFELHVSIDAPIIQQFAASLRCAWPLPLPYLSA